MQNPNTPPQSSVSCPFVQKHQADVIGVLRGFDRLRLRGTLRALYQPTVLLRYLFVCQVLLKGFKNYAMDVTQRIIAGAEQMAQAAARPWHYLNSSHVRKDQLARQFLEQDPVEHGLIAIMRAVEPCQSYVVRGQRQSQRIELRLEPSRCLHLYFYHQHPILGFMHLRLQTWFPFQVEVCCNGREWLARQLDQAGVAYRRRENSFPWIGDVPCAQDLLDKQLRTPWAPLLQQLLEQNHPLHKEIGRPLDLEYYWTVCESEFATDVMFRNAQALGALYPQLVQHGMTSFGCADVLRFLGRRVPSTGRIHPGFEGEVVSDLKHRPQGVRLKHRVNGNSIKVYDKFGTILRVETTLNQPKDFRVYRAPEGQPQAQKKWRALRRGLADLNRRAEVSQAANERYLQALASVNGKTPLAASAARICQPVHCSGRRYRALQVWAPGDAALLAAVSRGEFTINGLRNRDLRALLFASSSDPRHERQRAAQISRKLALLRAHGILRKVSGTHRYVVTPAGRQLLTALLAAYQADVEKLTQLAA